MNSASFACLLAFLFRFSHLSINQRINIRKRRRADLSQAKLKINGYCDQVLKLVVENLQPHYTKLKVNDYSIKSDPIIKNAVKLTDDELNTTAKSMLTERKSATNEDSLSSTSSSSCLNEANANAAAAATAGVVSNSWFTRSFKERKTTSQRKTKRLT